MRNIIVVDCISTGIHFIGDIINRGYNPIVLELKAAGDVESYKAMLKSHYDEINEKFDMIYEKDTYEETLEEVRKADPALIVPGNEHGVILATKLANDLGLLCNPIENLDAITLKHEMHNRLAEKGLRHIRGKPVRSLEEAIEFYDSKGLEEVVIKPIYSAGSTAVRICSNKEEMIDAIKELFNMKNYYGGDIDELLVQERIKGEEYIVNTVSCEGLHRVTLIWKYHKVKTNEGAIIYDTVETINELGIAEAEMVEYAYNVADALGIKYGPVHGEYMIDEKGPVLIEVNCRPCGGNMPAKFLDRISGQHETDSILDSAYVKQVLDEVGLIPISAHVAFAEMMEDLDKVIADYSVIGVKFLVKKPVRFFEKAKQRYRLLSHGALKMFIVPEDIMARSAPMTSISPNLKSFHKTSFAEMDHGGVFFTKTEDLNSTCGIIYLLNEDKGMLHDDINFLRSIEKYAFGLILSPELDKINDLDEENIANNLERIIERISDYGTGLLITDQFLDNADILQINLEDISNVNEEFDYVIVNLNKSFVEKRDDITVEDILSIFKRIKVGGMVFVPETTYRFVPGQRKGIEALMINLDLRIEVPPHRMDVGVIASRNVI